jgi:hypothetical protein
MAVFGKKHEASDESDFLRIPSGTRIAAGTDGRLNMAFGGDMSFGEAVPELSELNCGRNLSIDAGVTIKADVIRVKATLELEAGARLLVKELEVERLVSRKGHIEARTISAGQVELEASRVVSDRITARENVYIDRGEMEIGAVVAQSLTVTKGTVANILITEVAKLEGAITKGGYENFAEFLSKVLTYHPEILNDRFSAEARRGVPGGGSGVALPGPGNTPLPEVTDDALLEPAAAARITQEGARLRGFYQDKEVPREAAELLSYIEQQRLSEVRKNLNPIYQRLASQGKIPEPVMDVFREIQKVLRDAGRRKEARPA